MPDTISVRPGAPEEHEQIACLLAGIFAETTTFAAIEPSQRQRVARRFLHN